MITLHPHAELDAVFLPQPTDVERDLHYLPVFHLSMADALVLGTILSQGDYL